MRSCVSMRRASSEVSPAASPVASPAASTIRRASGDMVWVDGEVQAPRRFPRKRRCLHLWHRATEQILVISELLSFCSNILKSCLDTYLTACIGKFLD